MLHYIIVSCVTYGVVMSSCALDAISFTQPPRFGWNPRKTVALVWPWKMRPSESSWAMDFDARLVHAGHGVPGAEARSVARDSATDCGRQSWHVLGIKLALCFGCITQCDGMQTGWKLIRNPRAHRRACDTCWAFVAICSCWTCFSPSRKTSVWVSQSGT